MKVTASSEGAWGNNLFIRVEAASEGSGFKITVCAGDPEVKENEVESFDQLTMKSVEGIINTKSKFIRVEKDSWAEDGATITGSGKDPVVTAVAATCTLKDSNGGTSLTVTATSGGTWGNKLNIRVQAATDTGKFKLTVCEGGPALKKNEKESFDNLTMDTVVDSINNSSKLIRVTASGSPNPPKTSGTGQIGATDYYSESMTGGVTGLALAGGDDGLTGLAYSDFIGDETAQNGLHAFDVVDDINIVAIPDAAYNSDLTGAGITQDINSSVISEALLYCKKRKDCFFVADPPAKKTPTEVKTFKTFNSSYGALYYPWVYINDPLTGNKKLVPPSGVVAGTYAYTDTARGVHKAPAGVEEGKLDSVVGVETIVTKGEHDLLNPAGVNVIRPMPAGICIWGARTLSVDPEWLYVNVRRLFLFLEESIEEGTQWVVFEPNDPGLWGKVKRNLTAFLTRVWRDGALAGSVPEEAFFVKVDAENNPPEVRDVGQLIIEVGAAPVKPAEFVIIRISQKTLAK
ncbi:MAG: phage tail sheath subtilisin-like domain-containing protein [Firmicutes bacterium]|nr:phage tail sheath subtilisin-like domain-containing protein [Bacillota bacterium]